MVKNASEDFDPRLALQKGRLLSLRVKSTSLPLKSLRWRKMELLSQLIRRTSLKWNETRSKTICESLSIRRRLKVQHCLPVLPVSSRQKLPGMQTTVDGFKARFAPMGPRLELQAAKRTREVGAFQLYLKWRYPCIEDVIGPMALLPSLLVGRCVTSRVGLCVVAVWASWQKTAASGHQLAIPIHPDLQAVGRDTVRPPDLPHHLIWPAVHGGRLH